LGQAACGFFFTADDNRQRHIHQKGFCDVIPSYTSMATDNAKPV
jgi:hypothetical protein